MVSAVTGQATHVLPVVLPASPLKMSAIAGVTLKTSFVGLRGCELGRIDGSLTGFGPGARFGVPVAISMARLTCSAACVFEEFGALAMSIQRKRVHNNLVALLAVPAKGLQIYPSSPCWFI